VIKRKVTTVVLAVVLLMTLCAPVMAAENSTPQEINLDLCEGTYETWAIGPDGDDTEVPASALLKGNIRFKDEYRYLSPLSGTINIDGVANLISVTLPKQSEAIEYYELWIGTPGDTDWEYNEMIYCYVEVNIEGNRYIGTLYCTHRIVCWPDGSIHEYGTSELIFIGYMDRKGVMCSLSGDWPEID
jgi:hypothetical protein